ncbi:sodium-dependent lysophosphatidylcholine symporter 1-like isoform X2 [Glandiceps talaboti]
MDNSSLEKSDERQPLLERIDDDGVFEEDERLTKISKFCYGVGGIPFTMTTNVISVYISLFLLEVAEIRPAYASVVVFTGKAWESVSNPTVGVIVDRVDTRFGKMKPWLVWSTPCAVVLYFFLWFVPDFNEEMKLLYYTVCYCAFQTFLTCFHLPYVSLTMYMSNEQHERDSATAYRMVGEMLGTVIGGTLVSQFLALGLGSDSFIDPCVNLNSTTTPTLSPDERNPVEISFMASTGTLGALFVICCITVVIGTKEKKDILVIDEGVKEPFCKSIKSIFSHTPYTLSLCCFLCVSLAAQTAMANLALYLIYSLEIVLFQYVIIVILVSMVMYVPLWQYILLKLGKKRTLGIALVLAIPMFATFYFLPANNVVATFIFSHTVGAIVGGLYLTPWSMMPDVLDDYTLQTGRRKDALFYSFYVFFNKFAIGASLGVSTLVLGAVGYETGACEQPDSVDVTMRVLLSAVPVILCLLAMLFVWLYPITELRRSETRTKLAEIRRSSIAALGLATKKRNSSGRPSLSDTAEENSVARVPSDVKFSIAGDSDDTV